jgi:hypothetical protein
MLIRSVKLLLAFTSTAIPGFSLLKIHDQDFCSLLDLYVFQNGASSSTREGSVILCRLYDCYTVVSARVYPCYHNIQVTIDSVHPLSLHCTKLHLYKVYRGFLPMQACAAGYALTYLTTQKLQLVNWMVIGLTTAKFKSLILPTSGFCLPRGVKSYGLRADPAENTTSNTSPIVAWCHCCHGDNVFTESLPSSGHLPGADVSPFRHHVTICTP